MVWEKKCPGCNKKVEKKFNFCPYCGISFKKLREEEDFGLLGREEDDPFQTNENSFGDMGLPLGLDKMINSLMKQLEKQMNEVNRDSSNNAFPKGFKIQISTPQQGLRNVSPNEMKQQEERKPEIKGVVVSPEEFERRKKLPKAEAESTVRRLSDRIVYELIVPGVKSGKDIVITKLEEGLEIKAYSKEKCYYKSIPLKVEIIGYSLRDDRLFLELKG